jgi:uncharacterized Ntn-hydrolase superfamily protein
MTFSIAASDPESEKMGIAISTAFIAVGAICPFVSENAAVSSQSFDSGRNYGERTVNIVDEGFSVSGSASLVVEESDSSRYTQLHGVDADGDQFTHTGEDCDDWAGHDMGDKYTVAGNMLAGRETINGTADAYENADGPFEERLLNAIEGGEAAGGDKRGKISAALLVYADDPKLYHNLRVDRSDDPIGDLWSAYDLAKETEEDLATSTRDTLGEDVTDEMMGFDVKR